MVFDEWYYINAARNIIGRPMLFGYEGVPTVIGNTVVTRFLPVTTVYANVTKFTDPNSEHPPLAKLVVAFSALLLGENATAYRLPSAVFGTLLLLFLYLAVKKLATDQVAFYAATFLAFETLTFVHSHIFMLDIFMVSLMVLGFCLFLRGHYVAAGAAIGLSALSKEIGIIGIPIVITFLILDRISSQAFKTKESVKLVAKVVIGFVLPVAILSALIAVWWKVTPSQQFQNIVALGGIRLGHYNLDGSYVAIGSDYPEFGIISPPWLWLLNGSTIEYYTGVVGGIPVKYEVAMNPMLIYFMLPAVAYSVWHYWNARDRADLFALVWWAWSYMIMYPLAFSGRVMYIFYMLPTMGAISIMVASLMCHHSMNRYIRALYLVSLIAAMLLQFPVRLFA
jgi:predicted membrane-bound dolichyl-phosphate-mannose-protein mannosyltransferase